MSTRTVLVTRIVVVIGLAALGIALAALIVTALLPQITDSVSYGDALPFIAGGGGCSCCAYLVLFAGAVMMLLSGRKKPDEPKT